jgi:hypothetical protein
MLAGPISGSDDGSIGPRGENLPIVSERRLALAVEGGIRVFAARSNPALAGNLIRYEIGRASAKLSPEMIDFVLLVSHHPGSPHYNSRS